MEDYNDKNSLDGKVQHLPVMVSEKGEGKKKIHKKKRVQDIKWRSCSTHSECFFSISSYSNV